MGIFLRFHYSRCRACELCDLCYVCACIVGIFLWFHCSRCQACESCELCYVCVCIVGKFLRFHCGHCQNHVSLRVCMNCGKFSTISLWPLPNHELHTIVWMSSYTIPHSFMKLKLLPLLGDNSPLSWLLASPSRTKPFLFRMLLAWPLLVLQFVNANNNSLACTHSKRPSPSSNSCSLFVSTVYCTDNKRWPPKSKAITLIVFIATPSSPDRALMWLHPRDSCTMEPIRHVSSLINTKHNKRPLFPGSRRPRRRNIMRASSSSILAKKKVRNKITLWSDVPNIRKISSSVSEAIMFPVEMNDQFHRLRGETATKKKSPKIKIKRGHRDKAQVGNGVPALGSGS